MRINMVLYRLFLILLGSVVIMSCSKTVQEPSASALVQVQDFHVSVSKLILLQGNASNPAISFTWKSDARTQVTYTIEAAISGTSFAEPIVLTSTNETDVYFTVKDFNSLMCKLLYANNTGRVEFRIRTEQSFSTKQDHAYSQEIAIDVSTYRNYITYSDPNVFKIPGNYQNWILPTAPAIISTGSDGEYEGYVNFTNQYPQLLMVKGNAWETKNTYSYIGADKFGFGGSVMCISGGAGVYLFKASTNTNKWGYTKINSWGIAGVSVPPGNSTDPVMQTGETGETGLSWSITTNLVKGDFRIRANNADAISFGQKASDETGTPSYNGDNIVIKTPGNYTIKLELGIAGNYAYSIQKNN